MALLVLPGVLRPDHDLKDSSISEIYRVDSSCSSAADLGRPPKDRIGTICSSWLCVSGSASESVIAAAEINSSSSRVGIITEFLLDGCDILLDLTTIGPEKIEN